MGFMIISSVAFALVLSAGCENRITDDWGPPAGWSRVRGTVTRSNGAAGGQLEILITRCGDEERFLRRELAGYPEYMKRVPYRLLPGIW